MCPTVDDDSYEEDFHDFENGMLKPDKNRLRRSVSWSGFSTYAQLTRFGMDAEFMGEPGAPDSHKSDSNASPGNKGEYCCLLRQIFTSRHKPRPSADDIPWLTSESTQGSPWTSEGSENKQDGHNSQSAQGATLPQSGAKSKLVKTVGNSAITTVAVRNLLYSLTLDELLSAIDESGYAGTYDFVYLPHKGKEQKNLGFAFVNFLTVDAADRFATEWHRSRRIKVGTTHQPLNISAAAVQGRHANEKLVNTHRLCRVTNTFLRPPCSSTFVDHSGGAFCIARQKTV